MPPERAGFWVPSTLVAAVVAISVGVAGYLLLQTGLRHSSPTLDEATRTGAATVGQAVAAQFTHALELGIPLDKLPGSEPYLRRIAASSPQVDGLALLDGAGRTIAATGDRIDGARFPIAGGNATATLVIEPESPLIDEAVQRVQTALTITALFAGVLAGGTVAFFFALQQNPARQSLLNDLNRVAAGDFRVRPPSEDRGPLAEAGRALALCVDRVKVARRNLAEAVATIRAIDFDGSLGRQVEAILRPLESRYTFSHHEDDEDPADETTAGTGNVAWRVAAVFGLYGVAFPYVANFAIDREPEAVAAAWVPVLPLLAELMAVAAGAVLGGTRTGRGSIPLALGCLILGACVAATYWCRDYDVFVMLRCGTGLGGGFVVAGLLAHCRLDLQPKDLSLLLIFFALLAAPLLAGIYAEAIGRRSGFLVLGIAILAATPFIAAGAGSVKNRTVAAIEGRSANRFDLLLGLAVVPAGAMVLVILPAGIGYDDYLTATTAAAVLAAFALAVPALPPLACSVAFLLAALFLHYPPSQPYITTFLACAALGLGAGSAVKFAIAGAGRLWVALGAGTAGALVLAGLAAHFDMPFAAVVAGMALVVSAVHFLSRRSAEAVPA